MLLGIFEEFPDVLANNHTGLSVQYALSSHIVGRLAKMVPNGCSKNESFGDVDCSQSVSYVERWRGDS